MTSVIDKFSEVLTVERQTILNLAENEASKAHRIFNLVVTGLIIAISGLIIFAYAVMRDLVQREPVCEMSVGLVNEQSETIWRKVVTFGKLAEQCSVHLRKGHEIFARGPILLKKFVNRDGLEKEYFELKAFSIGQSLL